MNLDYISSTGVYLAGCIALVTGLSMNTAYNPDYRQDEISDLPGLSPQPSFKQYSGYLKARQGTYLHYWFVESVSDPTSDPVVLWLNGGPGCSSLEGMLTENGPFRVGPGKNQIVHHPYSWNKISNMLFLEAPAGVGFSFAKDGNYTTNDDQTAEDNYLALRDFFTKFAQFKGREFYITGESYAGIYIPTLMVKIMNDPSFNMKGAAIGNGYMKPAQIEDTKFPYWYYHAMMDSDMWISLQRACCTNGNGSDCQYIPYRTQQCQQEVARSMMQVTMLNIDPYNIYHECQGLSAEATRKRKTVNILALNLRRIMSSFTDVQVMEEFSAFNYRASSGIPCSDDSALVSYLNRNDVKEALHIPDDLPRFAVCSDKVSDDGPNGPGVYTRVYDDMTPQFKSILAENKYRLLVFNGDLDTVCNFFADQLFVDDLNLKEVKPHKPWYYEDEEGRMQVGGFIRQYANLSYMTVKGAGHMVPTDQPRSSFEMFRSFIRNIPF